MSTRQQLDPEVIRVQVLDPSGRPHATGWYGRVRATDDPPLRITVDTIAVQPSEVLAAAAEGSLRPVVEGIQVTLSAVRYDLLARTIADSTPRGGYADPDPGARSLGLDAWVPEEDQRARDRGYTVQHWAFPRLVLGLIKPTDDTLARLLLLDDPGSEVPEAFAAGLAIEHEARAGWSDLWWPSVVGGSAVMPPVRAYQWIREQGLPPVPV